VHCQIAAIEVTPHMKWRTDVTGCVLVASDSVSIGIGAAQARDAGPDNGFST